MEVEDDEGEDHVVLAFERRDDAEAYARSLHADAPLDSEAEVQALDLEALIVTSREADFRVALVFAGDLEVHCQIRVPILGPPGCEHELSVSGEGRAHVRRVARRSSDRFPNVLLRRCYDRFPDLVQHVRKPISGPLGSTPTYALPLTLSSCS